jgi:hypothetical protein
LWTGQPKGDTKFEVLALHVPKQTAYRTGDGLSVVVDGQALHQLNTWLYEADQVLAVQIHCHPDKAYHSETDDEFPIVTQLGGASVVVPKFCRHGLLQPGTMVYRLTHEGWAPSPDPAHEIIRVI